MSTTEASDRAPRPGDPAFAAAVRRLEPWWFAFDAGGHRFGGRVPRDTEKVRVFFEWIGRCRGTAATILELGSHEGSHSLQLAAGPGVERVVGLEGRPDNVERARLVQRAFGVRNVEFRLSNLEAFDPAEIGPVDAAFCAGLLYHLPEPWALVERLAPTCRFLFLDTHYAAEETATAGRYRGCWKGEGRDPLSGLSRRSFWLSFRHLVLLLLENGFLVRFVRDYDRATFGSRAWFFAERAGPGEVACDWSSEERSPSLLPASLTARIRRLLPALRRR
jgi:hypothetical protein